MAKNKSLPKFANLTELVEFFETHDTSDYWASMPEADFEIDLKQRTHVVTLDDDLADRIAEIARTNHVPSEQLINTWLREKVRA